MYLHFQPTREPTLYPVSSLAADINALCWYLIRNFCPFLTRHSVRPCAIKDFGSNERPSNFVSDIEPDHESNGAYIISHDIGAHSISDRLRKSMSLPLLL